MAIQELPRPHAAGPEVMPVHGIDHLELFVGNAAQAAYYYTRAFGFTETAYCVTLDRVPTALVSTVMSNAEQREEWKSIPVIVVTSKDLSAEDRMFLNGSALLSHCVRRVLQKGSFTRDDLLREVHELMTSA